ncbi:MAG: TRAP transporter large permease [Pseudomonadota bacterium]
MIALLFGVLALLALAGVGFPLGFSLLAVGSIGFALNHPRGLDAAATVAGQQILELAANFQFAVLPLFILMGVFVARSGVAERMFNAASIWLGQLRGGLALSTVVACGGLAAVSGSSMATAATMTQVAIPSMRRHHYDPAFSAGTVAAGGTIGILIPPSGALIVYGLLSETDIARLFVAGLVPGVISICFYVLAVQVVCLLRPDWAPPTKSTDWTTKLSSLKDILPIVALFTLIMGGIFAGAFTASEGGGIGALGALLIAVLSRRMDFQLFKESLAEAARLTATVFSVGFGALTFNQFVNVAGAPQEILAFIEQLSIGPWGVVCVILICFVILGTVVDGPAMIFLTVPIFVPVIDGLALPIAPDLKLVWWGIITVVAVEISFITPPIGMNVFVIQSMLPDVSLREIYRGVLAFFIADLLRLALFVSSPWLVLSLVNWMG